MSNSEELSEFMQDYNDDCQATITAGQLQHLVNEKNAAEVRMQELEAQVGRLREYLQRTYRRARCGAVTEEGGVLLSEIPAQHLEAVKREARESEEKARKLICGALGLNPPSGITRFAWSYLAAQVKIAVECAENLSCGYY